MNRSRIPNSNRRKFTVLLAIICTLNVVDSARANTFSNQQPATNGGITRWSTLWVDPTGQNDLDSDSMCFEDFLLSGPAQINHLEWWGDSIPNKGFQLEVWKQDPGTVAYQPYAVWRGAGGLPNWHKTITIFNSSWDSRGMYHFTYDLTTPFNLAANDSTNPRWFLAVIGLTDVAFLEWNWSQGLGGSTQTMQWIRGGGNRWYHLAEGRAMVIGGNSLPATLSGVVSLADWVGGSQSCTFTLTPTAGGTSTTITVPLASDGSYSFSTLLQGQYHVAAKVSHWLNRQYPTNIQLGSSSNTAVNFDLINGDIDGDNEVGPGDFGGLSSAYGSVSGDANFSSLADLDGDFEVGPSDFGILSTNYGLVGD